MNIISNNCIGGYFYREINENFKNPFIWCVIRPNSMYNLITQYENIDFNNIEIKKDDFYHNNKPMDCFKIIIDNKVVVHYTHHHFSALHNSPTKIHCDIFYNKIWELVYNNYIKRITRMTKDPIFLLLDGKDYYNLEEDKKLLNEIKQNNRKCIFITKYKELLSFSSDKILILYDKNTCIDAQHGPSYYTKMFCSKILDFIKADKDHV